jgi:hypothetical protein
MRFFGTAAAIREHPPRLSIFLRGEIMAMEQAKECAHRPHAIADQLRLLTASTAVLYSIGLIVRDFVAFVVVTMWAVMGFAAIDAVSSML